MVKLQQEIEPEQLGPKFLPTPQDLQFIGQHFVQLLS